jgi:hypothetical protein
MSGPPYPHPNPAPGSNAIGRFAIGISPIGTITPFDPWSTVISQYANSNEISAMIVAQAAAIDQTQNTDELLDNIWNVQTAIGYGLDVLGRIVGVSRTIQIPGGAGYFGFNEPAGSWNGFGGPDGFYSGGGNADNYILSDYDFRILILAKAAGNISDGSIPSLNAILLALFPNRGVCHVVDNHNMSITYVFDFPINAIEVAIIQTSGVLPRNAGVSVSLVQN